ncbi:MAG: hypothetical protein ABFC42_08635 [Sulfuricella sp.]
MSFAANIMKRRLFVSMFMFVAASGGVAAEPLNLQPAAAQEQIEGLKKQNREMRLQIEALRQQRWQSHSPRRVGDSAAPQVVLITNGKDAKANVQSLKQAIEVMNGRS